MFFSLMFEVILFFSVVPTFNIVRNTSLSYTFITMSDGLKRLALNVLEREKCDITFHAKGKNYLSHKQEFLIQISLTFGRNC